MAFPNCLSGLSYCCSRQMRARTHWRPHMCLCLLLLKKPQHPKRVLHRQSPNLCSPPFGRRRAPLLGIVINLAIICMCVCCFRPLQRAARQFIPVGHIEQQQLALTPMPSAAIRWASASPNFALLFVPSSNTKTPPSRLIHSHSHLFGWPGSIICASRPQIYCQSRPGPHRRKLWGMPSRINFNGRPRIHQPSSPKYSLIHDVALF